MENSQNYEGESYYQSLSDTPGSTLVSSYEEIVCGKTKYYKCTVPDCSKTFKYMSELARHNITHSEQRPYCCTFEGCDKSFKRIDSLDIHLRSHLGVMPYACEFPGCDFRCSNKSKLYYHMTKHEGAKKYRCTIPGCNKFFSTKAHLKQHENALFYHMRLSNKKEPIEPVKFIKHNPQYIEDKYNIQNESNLYQNSTDSIDSFFALSEKKESQKELLNIVESLRKENELLKKALEIHSELKNHIIRLEESDDQQKNMISNFPVIERNMFNNQDDMIVDFLKEKPTQSVIESKYSWSSYNLQYFEY